jgi:putative DNA primase/helicase
VDKFESFRNAMLTAGITPPNDTIADGKIHRFRDQDDKPGAKNAWYVFYDGPFPGGAFGNWRKGISVKWRFKACNRRV